MRFEIADESEKIGEAASSSPSLSAGGKNLPAETEQESEEPSRKKQKLIESKGDYTTQEGDSLDSNMVGHGASDDDYLPANHKFQLI